MVVAAVGLITAAVGAGTFAERAGSGSASSRVRLLVRLTGPAPTQQSGGLPGSPGRASTPGGPGGPAPTRRGTFILTGGIRDRGAAVLRLPSLGAVSHRSTLLLRSARGLLRVSMSGSGTTTSGDGERRWRVLGGSGAYSGASGSGTLTQTPKQALLVGRLTVRGR
jgi:hypothetical protein